jgi:hypothetical protein
MKERERIGSSRREERRTNLEETNEEKERKQGQGKGEKGTGLEEKNEGKYMKQGRAGVGEKGVLVYRRMKERIGSREEQGKSRKENWFTVEKNEGKDRRLGRAGEGEKEELV